MRSRAAQSATVWEPGRRAARIPSSALRSLVGRVLSAPVALRPAREAGRRGARETSGAARSARERTRAKRAGHVRPAAQSRRRRPPLLSGAPPPADEAGAAAARRDRPLPSRRVATRLSRPEAVPSPPDPCRPASVPPIARARPRPPPSVPGVCEVGEAFPSARAASAGGFRARRAPRRPARPASRRRACLSLVFRLVDNRIPPHSVARRRRSGPRAPPGRATPRPVRTWPGRCGRGGGGGCARQMRPFDALFHLPLALRPAHQST